MSDNPAFSSGVDPALAMTGDSESPRSESGIGALMPWADRLWAITYPAHGPGSGSGTGLYVVDDDLDMEKHPKSVVATCANRMVHSATDQLLIGPYVVDADGNVDIVEDLLADSEGRTNRLTATMEHLEAPDEMVYYLTMEGLLYEMEVETREVTRLFDLNDELDIEGSPEVSHFKGGHAANGRVVVSNNTYYEPEIRDERQSGRLAEYGGESWTVLEREPFMEVAGRNNFGEAIFATGWDDRSAILKVYADGEWRTYRLPKASHTFDHGWQTEWTRIREVETERYLMDCHGMFYELSPVAYDGRIWGVRPVSSHLRVIPDYCSFRGMFVAAGNETTPIHDANAVVGQPQSGLWFGKTDDLWEWGKPQGWGGPWTDTPVEAGDPSDPFLMTGFEETCLHLEHDADEAVTVSIEVDFDGTHRWRRYDEVVVEPGEYEPYQFPSAFSAHWVRFSTDIDCAATAQLTHT
jgi:hypothetical protein